MNDPRLMMENNMSFFSRINSTPRVENKKVKALFLYSTAFLVSTLTQDFKNRQPQGYTEG